MKRKGKKKGMKCKGAKKEFLGPKKREKDVGIEMNEYRIDR